MSQRSPVAEPIPKAGAFRWVICGLLFLATTINYVDRQVLPLLADTLSSSLHWSEVDYGHVVSSFQLAYGLGYLFTGRLIDRLGVRWGLALAVGVWSLASGLHGFVASVGGFCAARFLLGLAEGGNFPAAVKSVGEWFPRRERALATGIFNSGSNVGLLVALFATPWITDRYGWPAAFFGTAAIGATWLLLWLMLYRPVRESPLVSPREAAYIESDPSEPQTEALSWFALTQYRATWAFAAAMFLVSPTWAFYLSWAPKFLQGKHALDLKHIGAPLLAVYLAADVGSVAGGWLSSKLIARGWSAVAARKMTMLVCALAALPVAIAPLIGSLSGVVAALALATAAHQGFSVNLYTIVTDTMPKQSVSSVVGFGGMLGAIGGAILVEIVGHILDSKQGYGIPFLWAAASYLLGLACLSFLLRPKGATPSPGTL